MARNLLVEHDLGEAISIEISLEDGSPKARLELKQIMTEADAEDVQKVASSFIAIFKTFMSEKGYRFEPGDNRAVLACEDIVMGEKSEVQLKLDAEEAIGKTKIQIAGPRFGKTPDSDGLRRP